MPEEIGIHHRVDADGILRIVFDQPGARVNLLNADILTHLSRLMDETRQRDDIRAVMFHSAKPGVFVAGMDVDQIASVTDAHEGAEGARMGQAVFQKVADLTQPALGFAGAWLLAAGTGSLAAGVMVASESAVWLGAAAFAAGTAIVLIEGILLAARR